MAISKIILNGVTQMDLTADTVAANNLIAPNTAHGADGQAIVGTATGGGGTDFVVELTYNSSTDMWTPTCTFAEIQAAYSANKNIVTLATSTVRYVEGPWESRGTYDDSDQAFYYAVYYPVYYGTDAEATRRHIYVYDSNGAHSDGGEDYINSLLLGSKTITANGTYDPLDESLFGYSSVTVNVQSGGSSKNVQTVQTTDRRSNTALGSIISLTCSTAGTYDVYWTCARTNTNQTWGSQLYINGVAYGSENTTWSNNVQNNHLTGVSLSANDTVAVYGRSRSGYYIHAPQLTIMQTA